ncbi:MAG: Gfo/Idh/MocA family protein, partial [Ilumatobacteraceae bacterium]
GYGYWGRVMTRNMLRHADYFVSGVFDPDEGARGRARMENLYTFHTLDDALDATRPELVIVATPIPCLVETSLAALSRYAGVLIAKPGATTLQDAKRIDSMARSKNRFARVDYTMTQASSFVELRDQLETMDDVSSIVCTRHAVGSRTNASIIHDLATHDLSLIIGLDESREWRVVEKDVAESTARIVLAHDDVRATIDVSTEALEPVRVMRINTADHEVVWDQWRPAPDGGPVWNRLNETSRLISSGYSEDTMMRRVAELLEEIA